MLRALVRRTVEALAPGVANAYRSWRDQKIVEGPPLPTVYGFSLAGPRFLTDPAFETAEIGVFSRYLDQCEVCIDVGANIGLYTCLAASRGKRVIAIEPMPLNQRLLMRNLSSNGYFDTEVHLLALSRSSELRFLCGAGTAASLVQGWAGQNERGQIVPTMSLDAVLGTRFTGMPLILKVDVEGFEYDVLQGAEETLARSPRPVWLVEISLTEHWPSGRNPKFRDTFELFWDHGYSAVTADAEQRPVLRRDVDRWIESGSRDFGSHNYIFTDVLA